MKADEIVTFLLERSGTSAEIIKITKIGEAVRIDPREIFLKNCDECHGNEVKGSKRGISSTSGRALHHSAEEFVERLDNGKDDEMPAFKEKLTEEEILAVVEFVRTEIQGGGKQTIPHVH